MPRELAYIYEMKWMGLSWWEYISLPLRVLEDMRLVMEFEAEYRRAFRERPEG